MSSFIPDPDYVRGTHRPYTSMWLGPFGAFTCWALAGLGLAAWIWWRAPLYDTPHAELPHVD